MAALRRDDGAHRRTGWRRRLRHQQRRAGRVDHGLRPDVQGERVQAGGRRLRPVRRLGGAEGAEPGNPFGNKHPVAVSAIDTARLYDLCQSVKVPGTPIVLTINAGGNNNPAVAKTMLIDMDSLQGEAVFNDIKIGRDAGDLGGQSGAFGQSASSVTITDLKQVARYTSAGQFSLTGLKLAVNTDSKECF